MGVRRRRVAPGAFPGQERLARRSGARDGWTRGVCGLTTHLEAEELSPSVSGELEPIATDLDRLPREDLPDGHRFGALEGSFLLDALDRPPLGTLLEGEQVAEAFARSREAVDELDRACL